MIWIYPLGIGALLMIVGAIAENDNAQTIGFVCVLFGLGAMYT